MSTKSRSRHLTRVGSAHQVEVAGGTQEYDWYVVATNVALRIITVARSINGGGGFSGKQLELHEVMEVELARLFERGVGVDVGVITAVKGAPTAQAAAETFALHQTVESEDDPQWYDNLNLVDCLVYGPLGAGGDLTITHWTIRFRLDMVTNGPGVHEHNWILRRDEMCAQQ